MNFVYSIKSFLHLSWLFCERFVLEKRRWKKTKYNSQTTPLVFYGHERIPSRAEKSGGAIIKFQDLCERFPNTTKRANLLYLASSALPIFPGFMVREAKRHNVGFILNQNGVAYPAWHGPGWERTNRTLRLLLQLADYVIYQSQFCKKSADIFLGSCHVPWTILYNPVDTRFFTPTSHRPERLRLLLSGSHQHFYRVRVAIEMMAHLKRRIPDAGLTVAGRYTWKKSKRECIEEARRFAGELGVIEQIVFKEEYSQLEASALFQRHHVLVHTKYNDPCPRLVTEALACGLPVVYSASGGVTELVGDEAGVGLPAPTDWKRDHPPDPEGLAQAVIRIWNSYEHFATAARKRAVQYFDVQTWIEKHEEIFRQLMKKHSRNKK
ncbi:MAG: glycosyltransferase family 4 protein [Deltaproteobacteria bacterium]|nr:glycosyltransferase family 4 protein [Deltaproteobacteria bacterium]MBW2152207.1 glycosyltransferase family 4 protein [Deltaproteobacteria bacterium]